MASRSGARQEFAVASVATAPSYMVISGIDTGFTGMGLNTTPSTFEVPSGGIVTTKNAGYRVNDASWSVNENPTTIPIFLGRNGRRILCRWRPQGVGAGLAEVTFAAIVAVTRTMNARGARMFEIAALDRRRGNSGGPVTQQAYVARYDTEDEEGRAERWVFSYRRASAAALIRWATLDDIPEGGEKISGLVEAVSMILRKATKNRQPVAVESIPFDVLMEVASRHPTFRDADSANGSTGSGASARGGADGASDPDA